MGNIFRSIFIGIHSWFVNEENTLVASISFIYYWGYSIYFHYYPLVGLGIWEAAITLAKAMAFLFLTTGVGVLGKQFFTDLYEKKLKDKIFKNKQNAKRKPTKEKRA